MESPRLLESMSVASDMFPIAPTVAQQKQRMRDLLLYIHQPGDERIQIFPELPSEFGLHDYLRRIGLPEELTKRVIQGAFKYSGKWILKQFRHRPSITAAMMHNHLEIVVTTAMFEHGIRFELQFFDELEEG